MMAWDWGCVSGVELERWVLWRGGCLAEAGCSWRRDVRCEECFRGLAIAPPSTFLRVCRVKKAVERCSRNGGMCDRKSMREMAVVAV